MLCSVTARLPLRVRQQVVSVTILLAKKMCSSRVGLDTVRSLCTLLLRFSAILPEHAEFIIFSLKQIIETNSNSTDVIVQSLCVNCSGNERYDAILGAIKKHILGTKEHESIACIFWCFSEHDSSIDVAMSVENVFVIAKYYHTQDIALIVN